MKQDFQKLMAGVNGIKGYWEVEVEKEKELSTEFSIPEVNSDFDKDNLTRVGWS